ncbi:MAG TPA: hypothetical protein PKJ87_05615, partial [Macellibacteroides fermentans]|nr:hypothetical protein [Macellibacteroides fermentans]
MIKHTILSLATALVYMTAGCSGAKTKSPEQQLAYQITNDTLMHKVDSMAREVVKGGFNAGDGYGEVWIRDYNTFIELAMEVMPDSTIQDNLITFFHFQGKTGDIVDGFIDINKADLNNKGGYKYRLSDTEPRYAAHKNTVETDHEASLVQAVWRYVNKSGNKSFLQKQINGQTVEKRLEMALEFLMNERLDKTYGLIWGATTADWGDVQPEHPWGVELDENSHLAIDIYDNAFFIIALNHFIELTDRPEAKERWAKVRDDIKVNTRKYLWDEAKQKFIPHIYLKDSPFPSDFDENSIYYHGGTAMAIEAGLLSKEEIAAANATMVANVKASGAPTIGLTLYPPYPEGFFQNKGMYPYGYQNGGDWTWFG